eukprot:6020198-Alexandrium_andersonii.AAC.1
MTPRAADRAAIHIVGVQEARWPCPTSFQSQGYTVLCGPAAPGSTAGCQLWVSRTRSVAGPGKPP